MPALATAAIYAHQGGWDEILFVLAPLLIFAGLLWMARRRVDRLDQQEPPADPDSDPTRRP